MILCARQGVVLQANLAAARMLGWNLPEIPENPPALLEPGIFAGMQEQMPTGAGQTLRVEMAGADGRRFWASILATRIRYQGDEAVAMLMVDIDDLYRTAEGLEAALLQERAAAEAQRRFLAVTAHEIRSPLAIIDGAAQRLERDIHTLSPEESAASASRIRGTVRRMLEHLENTLEQAHDNVPAFAFRPVSTDLRMLIHQVAEAYGESDPEARIDVCLPWLPRMELDPVLIAQAVGNLLANALKYADSAPHITIRAECTDNIVQITVTDNGIGIPEEDRRNIFSAYVRGGNVGSIAGTGLGLSIVRQTMELHNGWVELAERPGPGATFLLTLPRPL